METVCSVADSCKNEHNDLASMSLLKKPEEEVSNGGRKIG